jgi:non-canonical purine NTP pyrophosphatase (RdgB/HAM1 family)
MTVMTKNITVVTGNKGKAAEIGAILGREVSNVAVELNEIQSLDVAEVAHDKALRAYEAVGAPVIIDDTGMSVEALGGLPGALVVWFLDKLGPSGILKLMHGVADRRASVSTAIGFADASGAHVFVGTVNGTVSGEERGANGFGYDPIFIPEGQARTYAEMASDEKNSISMRAIALGKLAEFLATHEPS